jgi:hypothetical protein
MNRIAVIAARTSSSEQFPMGFAPSFLLNQRFNRTDLGTMSLVRSLDSDGNRP